MSDIEADVVVVGSGVAGALLAERLARAGVRVAILEAGPRIDRGEALDRYFAAPFKTPESPYAATHEADFPRTGVPGRPHGHGAAPQTPAELPGLGCPVAALPEWRELSPVSGAEA